MNILRFELIPTIKGMSIHMITPVVILLIVCLYTAAPAQQAFTRKHEPRERAFSLLVPRAWIVEGGAIRILDPNIAGVMNMVDCKFDLAVKKDARGSVMIRWMPEMLCIDTPYAFGNPEGRVFNNALVRTKRSPERFITDVAIPYAHPRAMNVRVTRSQSLPGLARKYQAAVSPMMQMVTTMTYYAGLVEFTYTENGMAYTERMVTVIEDYGQGGGGLWKNRESILIRAPQGDLKKWESTLSTIQNSGIWNLKWVVGEVNGQRRRSGQIALTNQEIQAIDREMAESRRKTNSAINHDMYLTLTGQADYVNPYTGKTEQDSSEHKYRWVDQSGNVIYSDSENYNPNMDPKLHVSGYKRCGRKD